MQAAAIANGIRSTATSWNILGPPNASLLEALWPAVTLVQKVAVTAAFIGLTVGLARARFYLPDNPVPITFQTFGILLMGGVLGWRWGLVAAVGYYLLGMAGAPVFQGGGNGWAYVTTSATAGYLLGFMVAAGVSGFLVMRGWHRGRALWPMLIGSLLVYFPALIWLSVFDLGWPADGELFSAAVYPFIPGDLVKLVLAALVVAFGWRIADIRNRRSGADKSA